jgi:hypothetical protein
MDRSAEKKILFTPLSVSTAMRIVQSAKNFRDEESRGELLRCQQCRKKFSKKMRSLLDLVRNQCNIEIERWN